MSLVLGFVSEAMLPLEQQFQVIYVQVHLLYLNLHQVYWCLKRIFPSRKNDTILNDTL